MREGVGELLQTDSPTGNAIESPVRTILGARPVHRPLVDRRVQVAIAAAGASFVVLGVTGGIEAAWLALLALIALGTGFLRPFLLGPFVALLLPGGEAAHVLGAQVAPLEAVVGGCAVGYLARVATRRESTRVLPTDWMFASLVAFIALSTLGPADDSDRFREVLFWGALGIVFHAVTTHLRSRRNVGLLLGALAASTLVEAGLALFEYVDRWSDRFSLLNGAIVYPLPEGTLGHSNGLAQFLVLAVLAVLALTISERDIPRRLGLVAAGAGCLALVVTFSRASWIAFTVGACVYLADRRTRVPALAAVTVVATGAAALVALDAGAIGARISSLFRGDSGGLYDFRLELAGRAARIAEDHPLTGVGQFQEVGVYAGRPDIATHPHNLFLGLAVFFGIPAALAFGGLVLVAVRSAWKRARAGGHDRLQGIGALALLVGFLVNGLLEYPFWNISLTVLAVLAIAVAASLDPAGTTQRSRS